MFRPIWRKRVHTANEFGPESYEIGAFSARVGPRVADAGLERAQIWGDVERNWPDLGHVPSACIPRTCTNIAPERVLNE